MIYSKDDVKRMLARFSEQAKSWQRDFCQCPSCNVRDICSEEILILVKDIEKTL